MSSLKKLLPVFISLLLSCALPAAEVRITVKNENNTLKAELQPESGLDYGKTLSTEKKTLLIKIENTTGEDVSIGLWRSPCPCLEFKNTPETVSANSTAEASAILDGTGYQGLFAKYMVIPLNTETLGEAKVFVPVKFDVVNENISTQDESIPPPAAKSQPETSKNIFLKDGMKIEFFDYRKGIEKEFQADAWVFAGKTCPGCGTVKHVFLPELFKKTGVSSGKVIMVDLDVPENMLLLMEIEEQLKVQGSKTPVLLWKSQLIYGREPIKTFVEQETVKQPVSEKNGEISITGDKKELLLGKYSSKITAVTIIVAGLVDGINPCVFSTLVFFISLLSVSKVGGRKLLLAGGFYCISCFFTYLILGLGIFEFLKLFHGSILFRNMLNWSMFGILIVFALISFHDAWVFRKTGTANSVLLQLPDSFKRRIHGIMHKGLAYRFLIPGAFFIGFVVTIIESVCTGQVYVPTLALLIKQYGDSWKWLSYLILYNIMFIIPLIAIFAASYYGATTNVLLRWTKNDVVIGKTTMGVFFLILGMLTLISLK